MIMKRIMAMAFSVTLIVVPALAAGESPTVGGDSGNTRYSSLSQINVQNVTRLGAAWVSEKITPPPSSRAVPVIDNGLIIFTAPPIIYAVNLSNGQVAWKYRTAPGEGGLFGPPGSPAREGVAVGEGLVFAGLSDSTLIALREQTGELVWKISLAAPSGEPTGAPSGAPLYADGLV